MAKKSALDKNRVHQQFAAECFDHVQELIDRPDRTREDVEMMVTLAHTSLWHRLQQPDCTDSSRANGYWLLARVYALADQSTNAMRYAQRCLEVAPTDQPACLAHAYEALARAAQLEGESDSAAKYLKSGRSAARKINSAGLRDQVVGDLDSLDQAQVKTAR